jgi:hypothetical protein
MNIPVSDNDFQQAVHWLKDDDGGLALPIEVLHTPQVHNQVMSSK